MILMEYLTLFLNRVGLCDIYDLILYLKETHFNAFANGADPDQAALVRPLKGLVAFSQTVLTSTGAV